MALESANIKKLYIFALANAICDTTQMPVSATGNPQLPIYDNFQLISWQLQLAIVNGNS